jgi:hypothetical protein
MTKIKEKAISIAKFLLMVILFPLITLAVLLMSLYWLITIIPILLLAMGIFQSTIIGDFISCILILSPLLSIAFFCNVMSEIIDERINEVKEAFKDDKKNQLSVEENGYNYQLSLAKIGIKEFINASKELDFLNLDQNIQSQEVQKKLSTLYKVLLSEEECKEFQCIKKLFTEGIDMEVMENSKLRDSFPMINQEIFQSLLIDCIKAQIQEKFPQMIPKNLGFDVDTLKKKIHSTNSVKFQYNSHHLSEHPDLKSSTATYTSYS